MFFKVRKIIFLCVIIFAQIKSYGQPRVTFITSNDTLKQKITCSVSNSANRFVRKLHKDGYIYATVDSIDHKLKNAYLFLGPKTGGVELYVDSVKYFFPSFMQARNFLEEQIYLAKKNGYSFAGYRLDTMNYEKGTFYYKFVTGKKFFVDSVVLKPRILSPAIAQRILGLPSGRAFDYTNFEKIEENLGAFEFITLKSDAIAEFHDNTVTVYVPVEKQRANSLDLLLAIVSDGQKLNMSGNLDMTLTNTIKAAEKLNIQWSRNSDVQNLSFSYNMPYLYFLPFGIDASTGLHTRDTLEFHFNWDAVLAFRLPNKQKFSAGFNQKLDYSSVNEQKAVEFSALKIAYEYANQQFKAYSQFAVGTKTSTETSNFGYILNSGLSYLTPCIVPKVKLNLSLLQRYEYNGDSTTAVYLGGYENFRGFDRFEIKANNFGLVTIEPRLYLGKSFLLGFYQKGVWAVGQSLNYSESIGFGGSFYQENSKFYVVFSLVRVNDRYFDLNNAKILMGYRALF